MTHWRDDPTELAERHRLGEAALDKVREGLREYLYAIRDDGDAEVMVNSVVIFESTGMSDTGEFWRPGHVVVDREGSTTSFIGLLQWQIPKLTMELMNPCTHDHD